MEEERRKRRRGRRRGRDGGHRPEQGSADRPAEERQEEGQPDVTEESEAPGVLPSRLRFRLGRRGGADKERTEADRRRAREERPAGETHPNVSPLSFWRRGRTRTYREQPMPKQTLGRTLRRVRGLYLPPWVPVAFIILVVFGILVVLFFARGAAGRPLIGQDHWHATYQVFVCGERQPNFPTWEGGVHTHGDGVIHLHPFTPAEEGMGARLVKWFEYGGGKLTQSEMRMPGRRETIKNGDTCDDGSEGVLQLFVNDVKMDDWSRYIPQDGDQVRIEFGPEGLTPAEQEDRIVIDESEATRTVDLEITGGEADASFRPDSIDLRPGETVKLAVKNTGSISHQVRVAGPDGEYNTSDDYVSVPDTILPDEDGVVVVRFNEEGRYEFQDPASSVAIGTLVAAGEPVEEPAEPAPDDGAAQPAPDEGAPQSVDVTLDVKMGDSFYEPSELEVEAGKSFRINLTNDGKLIHNLRIAGVDSEYETADDLISTPSPLGSGVTGELVGQIDEPGVYSFRSDFQTGEMVGTITVK